MSSSKNLVYPPQNIIEPPMGLTPNFKYIILWMLNNNEYCEWSDFTAEVDELIISGKILPGSNLSGKFISDSTLSGKLKRLISKGYIEKPERNRYQITLVGKEKFRELTLYKDSGKRKIRYPPKVISEERNYADIILWMLYNNAYCRWSDFLEEVKFKNYTFKINQSSLSKNKETLMDKGLIINENKEYRITSKGKAEYFQIIKHYDLDRQSILEEETKRIEEITEKTRKFFKKYEIEDDNLKFRFLNYILKLDYDKVQNMIPQREEFNKILLYIAYNHPNQYPNYLAFDEFSLIYKIKKTTLEFFIEKITSAEKITKDSLFPIKFFKLSVDENKTYYFQEGEKIEKILRTVVKDVITKDAYLNRFYKSEREKDFNLGVNKILDEILEDICGYIFNEKLIISLRLFLPEYIKYLAYKIESEKTLKNSTDKLEGVKWYGVSNAFQAFNASRIYANNGKDEVYYNLDSAIFSTLEPYYLSKINFINSHYFKEKYFSSKNLPTINKVIELLQKGDQKDILKAREYRDRIQNTVKELELLIIDDLIESIDLNLEKSIELTSEIIKKYFNLSVGYLLQSLSFFKKADFTNALDIINKGLGISNDFMLICQKAQLLIEKGVPVETLNLVDEALKLNPNNTLTLRTKAMIYALNQELRQEHPEAAMKFINTAIELEPSDLDLSVTKALILCLYQRYKEAKKYLIKDIGVNLFTKNPHNDPAAFFTLAFAYVARGKFKKALEVSNLVLQHYSDHPTSYITKAMVLGYSILYDENIEKKNYEPFVGFIDKTIEMESLAFNKAMYYHLKSLILLGVKGYEAALEAVDQALELIPNKNQLIYAKLFILMSSQKDEEAIQIIDELFSIGFKDICYLYTMKSFAYYKINDFENGLMISEEGLKNFPEHPTLLNNKAIFLSSLGDEEEALKTIRKLVEMYPNNGNAYDSYGQILMDYYHYEDAIKQFEEALRIEPHGFFAYQTYTRMGECYKELGNFAKAEQCYLKGKLITDRLLPGRREMYSHKADEALEELRNLKNSNQN